MKNSSLAKRWTLALVGLVGLALIGAAKNSEPITVRGTVDQLVTTPENAREGWLIDLDKPMTIDGKQIRSLEITGDKVQFEKLQEKHVEASGNLIHAVHPEKGESPEPPGGDDQGSRG